MTVNELFKEFDRWNGIHRAPRTGAYYRECLAPLLKVHGQLPAEALQPLHLGVFRHTWHRIMAVQRLYKFAVDNGLVHDNPFRKVPRPKRGARRRVLSRREFLLLLRCAQSDFRALLLAGRETAARPQELRVMQWNQVEIPEGTTWAAALRAGQACFVLSEFKGRLMRADPNVLRYIPISPRLGRLLLRMSQRSPRYGLIFKTFRGLPWKYNTLRCRMRRLRASAPIDLVSRGEKIVLYTMRHSTATNWAVGGMPHAVVQELLGHTTPRMTQRYLHLGRRHMLDAWQDFHARRRRQA